MHKKKQEMAQSKRRVDDDFKKAVAILRKAEGIILCFTSFVVISHCYQHKVERCKKTNLKKAYELYEKAAAMGHITALGN